MRKTTAIFFTGALLLQTTIGIVYAQQLKNSIELTGKPSMLKFISSFGEIDKTGYAATVRLNELNAKAVRHFTKYYKNVPDPKWFKSDNGFVAYYTSDDIKTWVFYAANGYNLGKVSHYAEGKLDPYLRHRVKSMYYDFAIKQISEVNWDDKLVYVISIEDRHSTERVFYKTIRIVDDGEMELIKDYSEKINHDDSIGHTAQKL